MRGQRRSDGIHGVCGASNLKFINCQFHEFFGSLQANRPPPANKSKSKTLICMYVMYVLQEGVVSI